MEYKFYGISKNQFLSKNNLFSSKLYKKKILYEISNFKKESYWNFLKNLWNEYNRNPEKIGYLDQVSLKINSLLKTKKSIAILDLGGGIGDNFYKLKRYNQSKLSRIKYYIIDEDKFLLKKGKSFFSNTKNLFFKKKIPLEKFSLILLVGTLQYINNFKDILKKLNIERPCYLYFSRTIFSNQNYDLFTVQRLNEKNYEQSVKLYSLKNFQKLLLRNNFKKVFIRKNQTLLNFFVVKNLNIEINYYDILFELS